MEKSTYTLADFKSVISRELAKRRETYPRIFKKKQQQWIDMNTEAADFQRNTALLSEQFTEQYKRLVRLEVILLGYLPWGFTAFEKIECFRELQRELRMRKQMYPRWIRFGIMDQETADREIAVWQALTTWFHQEYCPDSTWRKKPLRVNK